MMKGGEEAGRGQKGTVLPWHGGCTYPGSSGELSRSWAEKKQAQCWFFKSQSICSVPELERMEAEGPKREKVMVTPEEMMMFK